MVQSDRSYPAARLVAPRIHNHFADHLEAARQRGVVPEAFLPDVAAIEEIIDAALPRAGDLAATGCEC